MEKHNSVRVLISGRVQGVFFRMETKRFADRIGVTGWVRNMADGRVEAFFQGDDKRITQMIDWCRKGPSLSKVTGIDVSEKVTSDEFTSFEIAY